MYVRIPQALLYLTICLILVGNFSTSGAFVCPSVCRCHYNVTVSCDVGLQTIPRDISELTKSLHLAGNVTLHNSFHRVRHTDLPNLSDLRHFTFSFNDIESIEDYTFSQFKELRQLKLNNNNIKKVGPETFSGLSKLEVLDLSGNLGIKIQDGTFRVLPSLKELYMGEINLQELDVAVFDGLNDLEVLDIHGNLIKKFDIHRMNLFPTLNVLDISSNSLMMVDDSVWDTMSKLQTIYIGGNPWQCNCLMKRIKRSPRLRNITEAVICAGPSQLQYLPLSRVSESDLQCQPPKILTCATIPTRITTGDVLQISCNLSGDPFPSIEWTTPSGDRLYPYNSTLGSFSVSDNGSLTVFSSSMIDSGKWTMKLSNHAGMVEREFTVDIQAITPTTSPRVIITPFPTKHTITAQTTKMQRPPENHTPSKNIYGVASSTPKSSSLITTPLQIPLITQMNAKLSQQTMADFNRQGNEESTSMGYVGIIVASVVGGCSLIIITTLLILLYKCISAKNRVGTSFPENTRPTNTTNELV
ncbi:immunoglobulin superfamily member 10-like [Ylistrum balloti]|uniref:immunoglobulin superfamily member 10-like n=1 Tax=Ylistrum balloti TaxID=509963 RepID=UPI002905B795|nr:immunoglobulin superfamily member 10-like [Ylistrum balloti]